MKSYSKILILPLLFFALNSRGQEKKKIEAVEIHLGSNQLQSELDNYESKYGWGIAIKKIWKSDKTINFVSGLLFENLKYKCEEETCGHFCIYENIDYSKYSFTIPLMLRANVGKKYSVFAETGPALEIIPILWGKGTERFFLPFAASERTIKGDFQHDKLDFGVNIGFGFAIPMNKNKIMLSSAYQNSFSSIIKSNNDELTSFFSLKVGMFIKSF